MENNSKNLEIKFKEGDILNCKNKYSERFKVATFSIEKDKVWYGMEGLI